ncbi:TPA: class I SAM-dependent methyltransferase [Mannheimia haemolytica]|uniref:Ribosomal RNA small subunit methyltransferase J n=1 Tax=Mannheimia haemolytica TaxID=75985 RepID=A0A547EH10_MANHA|nr:class I SAM-dependent methyltransferase [Mannheimia haemolytica]AWW72486.1 16S rRNA (guanine(1516)-N(2))-methyltransferase [Pasteurellaceae bacterium 12565]AGI33813.1 16S rRNA (guanine(1516)-N(2))-methyltransferase [Mannheimia haemolytica USDA-ARS-USMARC-183]AGI34274.1 16S rRNA (guanine(1516)-N(2))-methyltransferase [Mannheimia haemolytica USDA-ARS-USMARC-185]AGK01272.1 16S rRNA methyltransferase RsmJ [Mannheimia haemolytica M42548]AGQ25682.1 methyltransferase [Mannheimia haemolytica D153]
MIQLINETQQHDKFRQICDKWQLVEDKSSPLALVLTEERLELRKLDEPKLGAIAVNFVDGTMAHRRKFGGGRGEAVAKAVGIKGDYLPTVIDATAGLGRDAFVLAAVGCKVLLVERNPIVAALLEDGLNRAYQDVEIGSFMQERMILADVRDISQLDPQSQMAEVVYLDPMYPHKQKSALVKKEMRVFQHLVGADLDSDSFFLPAKGLAKKRVVVKRPDYAPFLAEQKPDFSHTTKNHRFDVYLSHLKND